MLVEQLVLTYCANESGRKRKFSDDMEVTAIMITAESGRRKKPSFRKEGPETLAALAKLCYPIWAIPWENKCFLIDGMGKISSQVAYFKPPDAEAFIEQLRRSTKDSHLYKTLLRKHKNTFSSFVSRIEIPLMGLISEKKLQGDLLRLVQHPTTRINEPRNWKVPVKIDENAALALSERVLSQHREVHSEIKGLQFSINTLQKHTEIHVEKIQKEITQIREEFEERISNARHEASETMQKREKNLKEEIDKIDRAHQKEQESHLVEKNRWEKELEKLHQSLSEYEKRRELRIRKGDEVGEARWKARVDDNRNRIKSVKANIKAISDVMRTNRKQTEKSTRKLRQAHRKFIEEEEKQINDIVKSCNRQIERKEKDVNELERETLIIRKKLEKLVDKKTEHSLNLKELTVQYRVKAPTKIQIPFYAIQYETAEERRFHFIPPMYVRGHSGLVGKIRRTLRRPGFASQIGSLLYPSSKALEKMLTSYGKKMNNEDWRELEKLISSSNLLVSPEFKAKLLSGAKRLEEEGWIKSEEKERMLEIYKASTTA